MFRLLFFRHRFITTLVICMTIACQSSTKDHKLETTNINIDDPNIVWAKSTNFKLDFNDESGQIKTRKILDKSLVEILLEAARSGEITVYDYYEDERLSDQAVKEIFHKTDTLFIINPDTEEEELKIVQNDLNIPDVTRFRVEQNWFYNKSTNQLSQTLVSISPLQKIYGADDSYRGDFPLFKIYLNK